VSRKASPTTIGAFTLGAVAVAVVALAILGGGKFLKRHTRAVAFFAGDIQGLSIGSPVDLRGVQIGTVTDINIRLDVDTMTPVIPVYMEFDPSRFNVQEIKGGAGAADGEHVHQQRLKTAIDNGLNARLAIQSLVTGQLVVELDLDPDTPRTFVGADPATVEIPTSPSDIQKIKSALARLPLDKLAETALRLMDDADRLVTSPEIPPLLRSLVASSDGLDRLIKTAQADLDPLAANANRVLDVAHDDLAAAQGVLQDAHRTLVTGDHLMSSDGAETLRAGTRALEEARKVLTDADGLLAANSPQRYDLDQTLRNLSATTQALRVFSEDLERRPNSIIMGK